MMSSRVVCNVESMCGVVATGCGIGSMARVVCGGRAAGAAIVMELDVCASLSPSLSNSDSDAWALALARAGPGAADVDAARLDLPPATIAFSQESVGYERRLLTQATLSGKANETVCQA